MPVVSIRHLTTYRYRNPVGFGEHRMMLRPLETFDQRLLSAEIEMVPADKGLAHFRLRSVSVGAFPVPDVMLRSMMMDIGDKYPALTKTGRDLFVQIPEDGRVILVPGAIRLSTMPASPRNFDRISSSVYGS